MMYRFHIPVKPLVTLGLTAVMLLGCASFIKDKLGDTEKPETTPTETGKDSSTPPANTTPELPPAESSTTPPPTTETTPPSTTEGNKTTYVVKKGDTLAKIAAQYNQTVAKLAEWNNLSSPYMLQVGQELIVGESAAPASGDGESTYTIVQGDTVAKIAKQHGCTVEELATWNELKPPYLIRAGQTLKIKSK